MTKKATNRDTIIDEIHRTREQMAEKFGGDLMAILEDAWTRQVASGRAIWQGSSSKNKASSAGEDKPAS